MAQALVKAYLCSPWTHGATASLDMISRIFRISRMILIVAVGSYTVMAQGADAHWPTAAKNGFGTSTSLNSKVWFTLANGVMTEVFYPTLDVPNVQTLQLQVEIDGKLETEIDDMVHRQSAYADSLTFRQVNASKSEKYIITKTYVTDPLRNTVLIDLEIFSRASGRLYVYYDPSLNNSGMHDSAWIQGDALVSVDGDKASALMSSCGFAEVRNGNLGGGFGTGRVNGNVVQIAELKSGRCTLALGFAGTPAEATEAARASLARGFEATRLDYEAGWKSYVAKLPYLHRYQPQFAM